MEMDEGRQGKLSTLAHMSERERTHLHVMINNNDKIDDGRYDDKPEP